MFLYITTELNQDIFDNYCERNQMNIEKELYISDMLDVKKKIASYVKILAIDRNTITNTEREILQAISDIRHLNMNIRIILVALDKEAGDKFLGEAFHQGIYNIITGSDEGMRNEEIKVCLSEMGNTYATARGYEILNDFEEKTDKDRNKLNIGNIASSISNGFLGKFTKKETIEIHKNEEKSEVDVYENRKEPIQEPKIEPIKSPITNIELQVIEQKYINEKPIDIKREEPKPIENRSIEHLEPQKIYIQSSIVKDKIKVCVCGASSRIGTTTQAILITKYLSMQGIRACYIEANPNKHIYSLTQMYDCLLDDENKKIQCSNIDLYYDVDLSQSAKIMNKDYEIFVFDYGQFLDTTEESFITSDVKIVVAGTKPYEVDSLEPVYELLDGFELNIIFSFVDEEEQAELEREITEYKPYFSNYAPSFFKNLNEHIYESIFKKYITREEISYQNTPQRKSVFNFKK